MCIQRALPNPAACLAGRPEVQTHPNSSILQVGPTLYSNMFKNADLFLGRQSFNCSQVLRHEVQATLVPLALGRVPCRKVGRASIVAHLVIPRSINFATLWLRGAFGSFLHTFDPFTSVQNNEQPKQPHLARQVRLRMGGLSLCVKPTLRSLPVELLGREDLIGQSAPACILSSPKCMYFLRHKRASP